MLPNNRNIRKPAITAQPHFLLSPSFLLVNLISESEDSTESVLPWPVPSVWRLHFLCIFTYKYSNKLFKDTVNPFQISNRNALGKL